jgi:hypothetical protein
MSTSLGVETTILAFYAAMVCGLISNSICIRAQRFLSANPVARHATALSVLFFISALVEFRNPAISVWHLTGYTTAAYVWFLMAAQGPFLIFVSAMKVMIVAYMCRVYAAWLDERAAGRGGVPGGVPPSSSDPATNKDPTPSGDDGVAEGGAVAELKWLGKDPASFRRASDWLGGGAVALGVAGFGVFLAEQYVAHKGQLVAKLVDYASGRTQFVVAKPLFSFLA